MNRYILRRRLHSSWLIAVVAAGLLVGVVMAQYVPQGWVASVGWLLVGFMMIAVVLLRKYVYLLPFILVAGVLIGLWRGSVERHQLAVFKHLYGLRLQVVGNVSEDVDSGKKGESVLRLDQLSVDGHIISGKAWVTTYDRADVKRGDRVSVEGRLEEGFGVFSAVVYRAEVQRVERPEPGDVARQVRDWFANAVRLAIPDPQASLGIGYLVGQRRALPEDLAAALQIAGLTHVVVASGYNLTILVRLARRLFTKVSKYMSALMASGMIVSFIAITGASPSMTRAGLVAGLSLLAWYYGRKFHPLILLVLVAAVTVLISPSFAWGDLGWQLSFAAFAGVMIVAPLAQRYFFGARKPGTIRQILGETVAAQLVTLPILVLAFGQFSNVAVVANLLVLPLVPLAMLLTFIAGITGLILPSVAGLVGAPAQWLLQYMIGVAEYLSKLPWAQTQIEINGWFVAVSYIVIILGCVYVWRKTKYDLRDSNIVE
ncbi:Competence protein [compost metagenome]